MSESNQTTTPTSESGSFIEDQLATLVDVTRRPANFRVDVVQFDPEAWQ